MALQGVLQALGAASMHDQADLDAATRLLDLHTCTGLSLLECLHLILATLLLLKQVASCAICSEALAAGGNLDLGHSVP